VVAVLAAATACAGASQPIEVIEREGASPIVLTAVDHGRIAREGFQRTGFTDLSTVTWVAWAARGCREGVWDLDVAADLGAEFAEEYDVDGQLGPVLMAQAVWSVALEACRGWFPLGADPPQAEDL